MQFILSVAPLVYETEERPKSHSNNIVQSENDYNATRCIIQCMQDDARPDRIRIPAQKCECQTNKKQYCKRSEINMNECKKKSANSMEYVNSYFTLRCFVQSPPRATNIVRWAAGGYSPRHFHSHENDFAVLPQFFSVSP